jgi:hypothetical protein
MVVIYPAVVPAKAETHGHRPSFCEDSGAPTSRSITARGYGSRIALARARLSGTAATYRSLAGTRVIFAPSAFSRSSMRS